MAGESLTVALAAGDPLILLNGVAATSADWDPSFIDRLASANEIIFLDNRGIGASNAIPTLARGSHQ